MKPDLVFTVKLFTTVCGTWMNTKVIHTNKRHAANNNLNNNSTCVTLARWDTARSH